MTMMGRVRRFPMRCAVFLIELYRTYLSPLHLPTCRFTPTCSQYAVDALNEYGLVRGGWMAGVRLVKCAPWHPGGWDPVPVRQRMTAPSEEAGGTPTLGAGSNWHV